jgi:hypothetical protein
MRGLSLIIVVALIPLTLPAQGPPPLGLRRTANALAWNTSQPALERATAPRTHWVEGAAIGAVTGFLIGAAFHCHECGGVSPMVYITPALALAFIGSMIGSGFRRQ